MNRSTLTCTIALALLLAGCAQTSRDPDVNYSGFLGDYSMLVKGGDKQAERRYVREGVDWASYDKVLLDPVMLWRGDQSREKGLSGHESQTLLNYFYHQIYQALESIGLEMVTTPMPNTLRVQVAVTKVGESHVVLDVVSSVVPATLAASSLKKALTGKPAFVGEAEIEYKVLDATTGKLLAAGVDHRVGGKFLNAAHFSSWGEAEEIMKLWATWGAYRLCQFQKRSTCVEPATA